MGRPCKDFDSSQDVRPYILGYTVGNDVSCRYWQQRAGAPYSKSFDQFGPIGPVIASAKVVGDPGNLRLTTKVNGETRQDASTADFLFNVDEIIRFLSRGRTLAPGTVIMTGTPSGIGMAKKPPVWIKDGDVVEIEIEKVGIIRNKFVVPLQREVRL
ncbi:uncharacterized protein A1O5_06642 [Cladophialophora psammophila CBS 110553]|uniref:Fumarylacetoacetase-like C-terminal domain-containing protein n=1 Tax=Cladophialophora psammophila CBS 110553 TaxID=1182543 RepID=W9WQU0_9EURO|nr:uncharacterized protein A1O5_06642 [Cladophialophora psammophila CBS 110553]EXJ70572.1 hypothetical protein A1O5_06642 [Cladophialophora psammophila CBS 110553]